MDTPRDRCSFCGVERWTVAAMSPCITETTFHSWTILEVAETEAAGPPTPEQPVGGGLEPEE